MGGLERGRCAQPPQVWYIVPDIDKIFDIEAKTSISLYPDIAPISWTASKFSPPIPLYPDITIRYRTRYRRKTSISYQYRGGKRVEIKYRIYILKFFLSISKSKTSKSKVAKRDFLEHPEPPSSISNPISYTTLMHIFDFEFQIEFQNMTKCSTSTVQGQQ